MATKKKVTPGSKARTKSGTKKIARQRPFQTDDPIIIKPGGSLLIEIDKHFSQTHTPSNPKKKGHKHPDATRITQVVVFKGNGAVLNRFTVSNANADAFVQVCYDTPNGCDCA